MPSNAPSAPAITGQWLKVDDTDNRLQVAVTAQNGLLALSSTFDPSRTIYVTPRQLQALAEQVGSRQSEIGQLIQDGMQHKL